MTTTHDIRAQLTGPGGTFEVGTEDIRGVEYQVYKQRMHSLREIVAGARLRGDAVFLQYGEETWTYEHFVDTVDVLAVALRDEFRFGSGDRLAILGQNSPQWCVSFWSAISLGGIAVGLNGWWQTDEIIYGLRDSGAKVLVCDRKRLERIADRLGECADLEVIVLTDAHPHDVPAAVASFTGTVLGFASLVARERPDPIEAEIDEDDVALIFYSSGTTGRPKGVMSTHRNLLAGIQNTLFTTTVNTLVRGGGGAEGQRAKLVSLFTSPLFHVSGCLSTLVLGMVAGAKLVMPVGRVEAESIMASIEQHGVTIWTTVPTLVWRVCGHPRRTEYDLSSLTSIAYGGSPSAGELQRRITETFPNVRSTSNGYGLTESSAIATVNSGDDLLRKPDSVGLPMPTVELRVVDDAGIPLRAGQHGEILIKAPINMVGYWRNPAATGATLADGWLATGDVGYVDDEGFLFITDRKKDMIIRGGENVYCTEIEERLVGHPAIADAAVIGIPHPELGEDVKAVVVPAEGAHLTEDDVRRWVADGLAAFKVPAHVELVPGPLPRNASGKLLKNVLRGDGESVFAETM